MVYTTGIHGNEQIPVFALASLKIPQLVCNLKALAVNKRFVEKDLNSSFGENGNTYEENRAKEILKEIPEDENVIDFHTTSANTTPFSIIVDLKMVNVAKKLGISKVVYMKYNTKAGHALINHRNGVSVEVGLHDDYNSFLKVKDIIQSIKNDSVTNVIVYEVYDIIENEGEYHNFEIHPNGFIPILAGSKAYNHYGFKSKIITI